MTSGVKAEQVAETQHQQLYRISPDDSQLVHEATSASHAYRAQRSMQHYNGQYSPIDDPGLAYSPATSIDSGTYNEHRHSGAANGDYYQTYERHVQLDHGSSYTCTCLSNQAAHPILLSMSTQVQSSLELLKRLPEHSGRHNCGIIKRMTELDGAIQ